MKFGDYECFSLEMGNFLLDGGAMFGVVPKVMWEKKIPAKSEIESALQVLNSTAGDVLGLLPSDKEISAASSDKMDGIMQLILDLRADLRKEKNFTLSDKLRDALKEIGITVKDTPDGSTWHNE